MSLWFSQATIGELREFLRLFPGPRDNINVLVDRQQLRKHWAKGVPLELLDRLCRPTPLAEGLLAWA